MERDLVMKAYRADRVRQVQEARRAVKLAWAGGFFDDLDGVARWPEEGGKTFAEIKPRKPRDRARNGITGRAVPGGVREGAPPRSFLGRPASACRPGSAVALHRRQEVQP
jgi:hypothetical protein